MEKVKDNPYVLSCEGAKPIIIETLTFLYDLDMIGSRDDEVNRHICVYIDICGAYRTKSSRIASIQLKLLKIL